MVELTEINVRIFSLDTIEVSWTIKDIRGEIYDYYIDIYRSNSSQGPWTKVASNLIDRDRYIDKNVNLHHNLRKWYYKLNLIHKTTGAITEYEAVSAGDKKDLLVAEIQRREAMYFKKFVGRKMFIYPRRTFGARCTCYDETLQGHTRGKCLACFNTGFAGGYLNPYITYVQLDPAGDNIAMTQDGEVADKTTNARALAIPYISPRDLIIEANDTRWRVVANRPTKRLRRPVHLELQLKELTPGSIAYEVPVDWEALEDDDDYWEKRPTTL